ncbi:hypothetical protein [Gordonia sihwensis]|uniref:hypothetical protein n=1 Tax=Gordonia sihwensis TaxID=173559 RepID=UPI0005EE1E24|nr:hypothetical protein [Gordonia sihwensis]KJR10500.1 hypothetical protein UG54_00440 [Gordonia sihwensis]
MSTPTHLTPVGAVNAAADLIDRTQRWLRTDQAAIMRQLPEQQSAAAWWADQGREHADSVVTVPAWIEHCYGLPVTATKQHPTLTATAAAVHELLTVLSRQLQDTPLYLVDDPHVRLALVTLARTGTYLEPPTRWPASGGTGTVLFTDPIPLRQYTAPDVLVPGMSAAVDRDSAPTLAGITWRREADLVRCHDWIHTGIDTLGVANLDEQIATSIAGGLVPPMLNNGHWKLPVDGDSSQGQARTRLMAAHAEVMTGRAVRWDGQETINDDDTLFAARLATVIADALAAELFEITERRITSPLPRRTERKASRRRPRRHRRPTRTVVYTLSPKPSVGG